MQDRLHTLSASPLQASGAQHLHRPDEPERSRARKCERFTQSSKVLAMLVNALHPTAAFGLPSGRHMHKDSLRGHHTGVNHIGAHAVRSQPMLQADTEGVQRNQTLKTANLWANVPLPVNQMSQLPWTQKLKRKSGPWGSFEHIVCINLDRRPERWQFMEYQFAKYGIPGRRMSAVDGQTMDAAKLAESGIITQWALQRYYLPTEEKLFGTDLTDGGIGCAMSHIYIWRDIIKLVDEGKATPQSMFLVLEDDCMFADDFTEEMVLDRLKHVPDDWEMIYLGGQDLMGKHGKYTVAEGVRRLYNGFRETTAYVINEAGAKACLEVSLPMYWQIDTHINDMRMRDGLRGEQPGDTDYTMKPRGYCLFPPIVCQNRQQFPTDVQKTEH